jgi:hypothetical protein
MIIALASTLIGSACSSSDSSTSPGQYVGNYTLVAIDGIKVPVGVIVNNVSVNVQGGSGNVQLRDYRERRERDVDGLIQRDVDEFDDRHLPLRGQ